MPIKKYALCMGMQEVDEAHYNSRKICSTASSSAEKLRNLLAQEGFTSLPVWTPKNTTTEKLKEQLIAWAQELNPGDLLVISFTGHGARITTDDTKIVDNYKEDEGWCLYDRVLFYFELWEIAMYFQPGVRILLISDACYSGTMYFASHRKSRIPSKSERNGIPLHLYTGPSFFNYSYNHPIYNSVMHQAMRPLYFRVAASVLVLTASAERGASYELHGKEETVFMHALCKAWSIIREENPPNTQRGKSNEDNYHRLLEILGIIVHQHNHGRKLKDQQRPRWFYSQGHQDTNLLNTSIFN